MEAVIIPAKTVVQINGVPAYLAVDTIVETEHGNMAALTGYHYAHVGESSSIAPSGPPPSGEPSSRSSV